MLSRATDESKISSGALLAQESSDKVWGMVAVLPTHVLKVTETATDGDLTDQQLVERVLPVCR